MDCLSFLGLLQDAADEIGLVLAVGVGIIPEGAGQQDLQRLIGLAGLFMGAQVIPKGDVLPVGRRILPADLEVARPGPGLVPVEGVAAR